MSTDAEELAKTIGGIKLRHIAIVVVASCTFIGTVAAGVSGYKQLGLPLPASQDFVREQIRPVSESVEELSRFSRQSRVMILSDKWWRLQEKIEEVDEVLKEHPANAMLRDQRRRLKRDQSQVQNQINSLERQP